MPVIKSNNYTLVENAPYTYLAEDYEQSSIETIKVQNVGQADNYPFLVIGAINNQFTEIRPIDSVDDSNNEITLSTATRAPHKQNTIVYFVLWDQVEFWYADNDDGDDKEELETEDIHVSDEFTYFRDDEHNEGFGFLRYSNSVDSETNTFSDPIPYDYREKSIANLKQIALMRIGEEDNTLITDNYTLQLANQCEVEISNMRKNWNWLRKDVILGNIDTGGWKLKLPKNIKRSNTYEAIDQVSIGDGYPLHYLDINEWRKYVLTKIRTTELKEKIEVNDTQIVGENFYDFPDEGTVYVGDNVLTYTSKTKTTLEGVEGADNEVEKGATIFFNRPFGEPKYFTTINNSIYFYPVNNKGVKNVYFTYYQHPGMLKRPYNETIIPDSTIMVDYLTKEFDMRINREMTNIGQIAYQSYQEKVDMLRRKETSAQKVVLRPAIRKKV